MKARCAFITTYDNPYDPVDDFSNWLIFDNANDYGTCSLLARLTSQEPTMTTEEERRDTERAIDEMIRYDFQGIYKKIIREVEVDEITSA